MQLRILGSAKQLNIDMGLRNSFLKLLTDEKYQGYKINTSTGDVDFTFLNKSWNKQVSKTLSAQELADLTSEYGHVALAPGFYVPAHHIRGIAHQVATTLG